MGSEIEVPETPNWLKELEEKRERRLKARLGHETGAGAPCLKCGDKCPGLDLHFWRKCCKICKCSKEEHEVQDDDIYGWTQLQLLGTKPKAKPKILLLGKKEEVELDWAPKGHKETIDKYLKTLPPEQLPIKGSQAAQDRKQLLQKQIPIHDIDPTLCHELNEDELKKMNEYIAHVKKNIVGVGQIISLSNIIKANLHNLTPSEAAIIASRYAKGIPLSEIVKLQSQSRASSLKHGLDKSMEKMNINDTTSNRKLPNFTPNAVKALEQCLSPITSNKIHDINYPGYTREINQSLPNAQFSTNLHQGQYKSHPNAPDQNQVQFDPAIDEKYLHNPNFDPKNTPSQFINQNLPHGQSPYDGRNQPSSAFVPYNKNTIGVQLGENYMRDNPSGINYATNVPKQAENIPGGYKSSNLTGQNVIHGYKPDNYENVNPQQPNYTKNITNQQKLPDSGAINYGQNVPQLSEVSSGFYENSDKLKNQGLPNYAPGKYNVFTETQSPTKIPKNFRDLAYSTYDPKELENNSFEPGDNQAVVGPPNLAYGNYPTGFSPEGVASVQNVTGNCYNYPSAGLAENQFNPENNYVMPSNPNLPYLGYTSDRKSGNQNLIGGPDNYPNTAKTGSGIEESQFNPGDNQIISGAPNLAYENYFSGSAPERIGNNQNIIGASRNYPNKPGTDRPENIPSNAYGGPHYEHYPTDIIENAKNVPHNKYPSSVFKPGYENIAHSQDPRTNTLKKLSELHPGKIDINEDFLQPSQVAIGAIQDINYPEIKAATQGTNDFYEDYSPDSLREILNNVKLPDCHYCKKPFEENEFAVTIDRANVLFHADCFKCAGCNQILADNVYFYNKETDNIYCGRDYAKIRGFPRCKACDELIFTKEYCLAENCTFHLKHFCCTECDTPLAGQDYTLEDEMPYCLPCFERSKASKCNSCGLVIKPDEIGCTLNNIHFHADNRCFACKMCMKPLMGKKLLLRNDKLYCSHDCFGADK